MKLTKKNGMVKVTGKKEMVKKYGKKKKLKDVSEISVEEFFKEFDGSGPGSESEDYDEEPKSLVNAGTSKLKKKGKYKGKEEKHRSNAANKNEIDDDDDEEEKEEGGGGDEVYSHKKSLQNLKKTDPDFYKYLEETDKELLSFDVSGDEADEEGIMESEKEEMMDDTPKGDRDKIVTLETVQNWQMQFERNRRFPLQELIHAFRAALQSLSSEEEKEKGEPATYIIQDSSVFNAVVRTCIVCLPPAIKQILKLKRGEVASNSANWKKVNSLLRMYFKDLVKLTESVASPAIVSVLLKHLHEMIPYVACFNLIVPKFIKKLSEFWSSGEETVRILAFLCILKLTTINEKAYLNHILKALYMSYVSNVKFVSPNTLPAINFMRRSLAEIYALDEVASYHHMFLYIRQLAIHLRNAVTLHKVEHMKAVYNWQYINSLHLWSDVLCLTGDKQQMRTLLYPLVQIMFGVIKLISTKQYFPLRFHIVKMLIDISNKTNTFIPVLPFLIEILSTFDFNKKHTKLSLKPLDFSYIFRVSRLQLHENGFKDVVISNIHDLILIYIANEAHSIVFPDLVIPTIPQIRKFLKNCKISNYCKKIKIILNKIEENSKFIEEQRKKSTFVLSDRKSIEAWETNIKLKGTPISKYFEQWQALHLKSQECKITGMYAPIPNVKNNISKPKVDKQDDEGADDEIDTHHPSESDESESRETPLKRKNKKLKQTKHKKQKTNSASSTLDLQTDDTEDIVEDLDLDDFV